MIGIVSDGSSDPSLWFLLLQEIRALARTAIGVGIVVSVKVSSSSRDALWWCRGLLWLRCRGRLPPRIYLLLRRGGRALLLLLLALAHLLLVQATMQSLQVARLTCHCAAQWALRQVRGQKGDH
jgi:cobalamin synthase